MAHADVLGGCEMTARLSSVQVHVCAVTMPATQKTKAAARSGAAAATVPRRGLAMIVHSS